MPELAPLLQVGRCRVAPQAPNHGHAIVRLRVSPQGVPDERVETGSTDVTSKSDLSREMSELCGCVSNGRALALLRGARPVAVRPPTRFLQAMPMRMSPPLHLYISFIDIYSIYACLVLHNYVLYKVFGTIEYCPTGSAC